MRGLRSGRGEQPRGHKLGFTSRTIWDLTLQLCEGEGQIDLAGTVHPSIAPEIAFGPAATQPTAASGLVDVENTLSPICADAGPLPRAGPGRPRKAWPVRAPPGGRAPN
ncbi:hypothetical protein GCM10007320_07600 [Pseudorhodoferax aquiterrae]|uniref:Uncharacterized protein n=1 Tax=Pseudorhodoferax aquiterrae TaxID=747304 RepID=A0ABQ3FW91_9BURK|nr:hypothetical protein GCM10007320_07600 [Pseudorhodoferax aquiterrae]